MLLAVKKNFLSFYDESTFFFNSKGGYKCIIYFCGTIAVQKRYQFNQLFTEMSNNKVPLPVSDVSIQPIKVPNFTAVASKVPLSPFQQPP